MDTSEEYTFAELLRQFRVREKMSQQQLADNLGVHRNTIGAWERGDYFPETTVLIRKVAEALTLNAKDEQLLIDATRERITLRSIWNVPYQRNLLFTGREAILTQLHDQLHKKQTVALTQTHAIHGLGGIGKTQSAVEYAHRHSNDYQAILWAQADSLDALMSSFVSLAALLRLPERDEQEQQHIVDAVKRWLSEHTQWLLVLDNVEDMRVIKTFLPPIYSGHVLLTTRSQALGGIAQGILLEQMEPNEGVLFLLRRATIIRFDETLDHADAADLAEATAIVEELGGIPLALDQAGAYIEEAQCSLSQYLQRYRTHRVILLKRRGRLVTDHPESIVATWSLSFEKVEQQSPAAADLLRFCSFLHPDAIPEDIITQGAAYLGPVLAPVAKDSLALDEAIATLGAYSLLRRNARSKTFSVHRLVQVVSKEIMNREIRLRWAERTLRTVNAAFPEVEFTTWLQCEQCLPHALACVAVIEQENLTLLEAASLLYRIGWYLDDRMRYSEAEPLYIRALSIQEQLLGSEHPNTASVLNNLALLYMNQGKYEQAEPLYIRALSIQEQLLGSEHPNTISSLTNLASLYSRQGKYEQAEPLYIRALILCEKQLGPEHLDMLPPLNNLARLYHHQERYEQVESLLLRALAICEKQLGPEHPHTTTCFNNLAELYQDQGKYEQAEPLYIHALILCEKQLGPEHINTARSLNNLALLYCKQGQYAQAEPLYTRALSIREKLLGPEHPETAQSLNNLATLYHEQGKYEHAEPLLVRALSIQEQQLGSDHPDTTTSLNNLAILYQIQGKYSEVEQLYKRVLLITEQQLGPEHPYMVLSLNNLAALYSNQGKYAEAESLYVRALSICKRLGSDHPLTKAVRKRYASLLRSVGRGAEAIQEETYDQDVSPPS